MIDPIVSRLDRLHDQWVGFADLPDARILRWLVGPDELRMVETFLAKEADDRAGELPDLFVVFPEAFAGVDSYGAALREGLVRQYDEGRPGMEEEGLDASWSPPPPAPAAHSLAHLIDACASLRSHDPAMESLVLVLLPSAISDYHEWQRWLHGAATYFPTTVRLVVVDDVAAPALEALAAAEPARVHSVAADLAMPTFLTEMARMSGTSGADGQFRVRFTEMTGALGAGKLSEAGAAAQGALAVAGEHGWYHLVGAVHFAMAAGLLNAGRTEEALAAYREADVAGKRLAASDEVLASRIRLTSAFGVGSALVGSSEFARAAAVYEMSATMAAKVADPWLLTECWRMAAYCHEQAGDRERAWERGFQALDAAEGIPAAERTNSTVPFVREGLLRLAGDSRPHADAVEQRVARLLGDGPRPAAATTGRAG